MTDDFPEMKKCFVKPSVVSYKRHKNLRDLLIHAKLPSKRGPPRRNNGFKNHDELCKMCAYSPKQIITTHTSKHTKKTYEINSSINCKTSGVVYKISCNKCTNFTYIGETGRPLKTRFYEHFNDATKKDESKPCGKHFNQPGHSSSDMRFLPFEVVHGDETMLRSREEYWIRKKKTFELGINRQK